MKLEAGKKYVLRNGNVEECLAIWVRELDGYHATVTMLKWFISYTIDGKCWPNSPSGLDIVAEYKEPVRVADYLVWIPEENENSPTSNLWRREAYPIGQQPRGAVLIPGSERDGG